jgi:hypothetical protein
MSLQLGEQERSPAPGNKEGEETHLALRFLADAENDVFRVNPANLAGSNQSNLSSSSHWISMPFKCLSTRVVYPCCLPA